MRDDQSQLFRAIHMDLLVGSLFSVTSCAYLDRLCVSLSNLRGCEYAGKLIIHSAFGDNFIFDIRELS